MPNPPREKTDPLEWLADVLSSSTHEDPLEWLADVLSSSAAPEEAIILAEHHKEILKRKFPNYKVYLHKSSTGCSIYVTTAPKAIGTVGTTILEASFVSSSVAISRYLADSSFVDAIVLDYADPKFTDDTLIDMLEELG